MVSQIAFKHPEVSIAGFIFSYKIFIILGFYKYRTHLISLITKILINLNVVSRVETSFADSKN